MHGMIGRERYALHHLKRPAVRAGPHDSEEPPFFSCDPHQSSQQTEQDRNAKEGTGKFHAAAYSSSTKSVIRTPTVSSIITISPYPIRVPPTTMSMLSPAERRMRITLFCSSSRICAMLM